MKENPSSLWSPNEEIKKNSNLEYFCKYLDKKNILKYSENFKNLWKWSVNNPEIFWSEVWNFTKIKGFKGKKIIVMSSRAKRCLSKKQIEKLNNHGKIIHSDLDIIEKIGGGSARCMIAENFLQKK